MMRSPHLINRRFFVIALALVAAGCVKVRVSRGTDNPASAASADGATTIVVVRHAEKSTDHPTDPSLSAAGQERARALSATLKDAGVSAIYGTQYKRTRQTAEPLAQERGIEIAERPATSAPTYAADLAHAVRAESSGKTVLIVGHSNTVPQIVQAFSGTTVAAIKDSEYDHLFVVVIPASGPARLFVSRYGRPTP
jgi:broad specificity phosphatase PhoE